METLWETQSKSRWQKNKLAPPFREAFFDIEFGKGISAAGEMLDLGIQRGVVRQSGSHYYFNEESLGHGREKAKQRLCDDLLLREALDAAIRGLGREVHEDTVMVSTS